MVDVRIRRADLPEQNSQAVYQRMQTERQREAAEFRAQGGQKAQEIRSKADREATVIIAEANSKAEQVRGEGDGERNRLFAEAYGKDPDFFAFYRSMPAYENGLTQQRHPLPAAAGFRVLPLLRQSVGQAAGAGGAAGRSGRGRAAAACVPARRRQRRRFAGRPLHQSKSAACRAGGVSPMRSIAFADFLIGVGHPVRARRPAVRGEPGLDAPGDEERAGDARTTSLRIAGIGSAVARPDPDLVGPALA